MRKPVIVATVAVLALVLSLIALKIAIDTPKASTASTVYNVCQVARQTDKLSESTCGDLQNYYHVEYMCEQANKLATNHCWVEAK